MSRRPRFLGLLRFLTRPPVRTTPQLGGDVLGLEPRVVPAYTFALAGLAANLTGDAAAADTLVIDQAGGLLRHNRDSAGDPNLNSDFDWNSAVAGDQTLSATDPAVTVNINMGGGNDTLQLGSPTAAATSLAAAFTLTAGGAGDDGLIVNDTARATPAAWTYTNTLVTAPGFRLNNQAVLENGEQFFLGSGGDTFTVTSQSNNLTLNGGAGADTFTFQGGSGSRTVFGGAGDDRVAFAAGVGLNDGLFVGGGDADTLDYTAYTTPVAVNLDLGTTGLTATLDGGQEVPSNGSPATGTAAVTNYDVLTQTFVLTLTVTDLAPADVTGLYLQRGGLGVNGPIILDLLALGPLVPAGTGFTLTLPGLDLDNTLLGGAANEAAFLGGQTYLNVRSPAFPDGFIRGQLFSLGNATTGFGSATGTNGLTGVENVVGGSAADSLVGNSGPNTLNGLGGNDTILGGPGADTFLGGADDDTLIWSNGDGSDLMDGEAGSDTVAVNGNLTANDLFSVVPNGSRIDFDRTSPGPFSLDIGTVETLRVAGVGGNDTFAAVDLSNALGLTSLALFGLAGNDTFDVVPFSASIAVVGGAGTDALTVESFGPANPFLTIDNDPAGGLAGTYAFGNRQPVTFGQVEGVEPPTNFLSVTKTDGRTTAVAGSTLTYTVTVTNNGLVGLTGVTVSDQLSPVLSGATWMATYSPGSSGAAGGSGDILQAVNLAAGGGATFTITGTVDPLFVGTLTNTVTVTGRPGLTDTVPDDNTATDATAITEPSVASPALAVGGGPGTVAVFRPAGGSFPSTPAATLAPFAGFTGGVRTSTADVNGDGTPDGVFVTGPGTPLRVTVISGADNTTVLVAPFDPFGGNFPGGGYVAAGDLDGDGNAEFVVTPDEGGGPRVTVFSRNADGSTTVRANFLGIDDETFRGGARAALGDVNGDGDGDVIVAAGFGGGPRTAIFGGPSVLAGSPTRLVNDFFSFPGKDAETLRNGAFVAAGDVTGDGFADLIFGGGPGGAPRVFILSGALVSAGDVAGAQAAPVANFFVANDSADRGGVRVATTDADGDNKADVAAGSGAGSPAKVRVYLGANFAGGGEPGTFQDLTVFGGTTLAGGVFVG